MQGHAREKPRSCAWDAPVDEPRQDGAAAAGAILHGILSARRKGGPRKRRKAVYEMVDRKGIEPLTSALRTQHYTTKPPAPYWW